MESLRDQKIAELLTVLNLIGKGKMNELTGILRGVKAQKQATVSVTVLQLIQRNARWRLEQ